MDGAEERERSLRDMLKGIRKRVLSTLEDYRNHAIIHRNLAIALQASMTETVIVLHDLKRLQKHLYEVSPRGPGTVILARKVEDMLDYSANTIVEISSKWKRSNHPFMDV